MMRRSSRLLTHLTSSTYTSPSSTRRLCSLVQPLSKANCTQSQSSRIRPFHVSASVSKGLSPSHEEPEPPKTESTGSSPHAAEPASITTDEYHDIADQYIDTLVLKLEEMAEDASEKLEVEYSAGVLTLSTKSGDYVLNKQPPNKQIWISSPISGPKRYDWVISGDHHHEKEGTETGGGAWVYLRDGSELSDLLKKEVGVEMEEGVVGGREGPGSQGS